VPGAPGADAAPGVFDFAFRLFIIVRHAPFNPPESPFNPYFFPIHWKLLNQFVLACYPPAWLFTLSPEAPNSSPEQCPLRHVRATSAYSPRPLVYCRHSTPLFPATCGLCLHNGRPQPISFQSLADSFHRNGGVPPSPLQTTTEIRPGQGVFFVFHGSRACPELLGVTDHRSRLCSGYRFPYSPGGV
jgi:hypothetical protein